MSHRTLLTLGCLGGLLATSALAFSPGPPRPIPPNVTGVCSVDLGEDPDACGFDCQNAGGTCLIDPTAETILAETRAVLTLIVDEDVAGWFATVDSSPNTSPGRLDNARLTVLVEFQAQGKPVAISETYQLDRDQETFPNTCGDLEETDASLCVPTWRQPITEANLIASLGEFQDLQLQWGAPNTNIQSALRTALLTPAQLALHPSALPLLEIVDGGVVGFGPFTAQQLAQLDQFDHGSADALPGLASVRRFKVTIKVVVP